MAERGLKSLFRRANTESARSEVLCHLLVSDAAGALEEVRSAVTSQRSAGEIQHLLLQAFRAVDRAQTSFETSTPTSLLIDKLNRVGAELKTLEAAHTSTTPEHDLPTIQTTTIVDAALSTSPSSQSQETQLDSSELPTEINPSQATVSVDSRATPSSEDQYPKDDRGASDEAIGRAALEGDHAAEADTERQPALFVNPEAPTERVLVQPKTPATTSRVHTRPPGTRVYTTEEQNRLASARALARQFYNYSAPVPAISGLSFNRDKRRDAIQELAAESLARVQASQARTDQRAMNLFGTSVRRFAVAALALLGVGVGASTFSREPGPIVDAIEMPAPIDESLDTGDDHAEAPTEAQSTTTPASSLQESSSSVRMSSPDATVTALPSTPPSTKTSPHHKGAVVTSSGSQQKTTPKRTTFGPEL